MPDPGLAKVNVTSILRSQGTHRYHYVYEDLGSGLERSPSYSGLLAE